MRKRRSTEPELEGNAPPSKSQRKHDAQAVLDLSKTIVELGDKLFAGLSLPDEIREAAVLAKNIGAYGGRKRQINYLAKLMRKSDLDAIRTQLQAIEHRAQASNRYHQQLEQWRDRLIDEGDGALADLVEHWPNTDRQLVRQLIRNAQRDRDRQAAPKPARALFRYLKTL
jgi:ribosome-associated protein